MNQFNTPQNSNFGDMAPQKPLPNATLVLVMGILSIVGCCCYGLFGLIFAIIALVMANKDTNLYNMNPNAYTASSFSNIKTGKILAIIGLVLSVLSIVYSIIMLVSGGYEALTNPEFLEKLREMQNQ